MKNHSVKTHKQQDIKYAYFYSFMETVPDKYYAFPKFLLDGNYSHISLEAKITYTLMRDRLSYSLKNKWYDESGRVYIMFTIYQTQQLVGISKSSALRAHKQLVDAGLIEKVNLCFGKPSRIYVKDYIAE